MNEIAVYQLNLPAPVRRELDRHRSHMNHIAQLAIEAMDEQSAIHGYAALRASSVVDAAMRWQQSVPADAPPEVDAWFHQLTQYYMAFAAQICQTASSQILQTLEWVPPEPEEVGLVEELLGAFIRRLTE